MDHAQSRSWRATIATYVVFSDPRDKALLSRVSLHKRNCRPRWYTCRNPAMRLTFENQAMDDVVVIRCKGRIAFGAEVDALQAEVNKHTKIEGTDILCVKQVVLQLTETHYIDSSGLGALVRILGV